MTIKINDSRPVPKGGRKIVILSEAEEVGASSWLANGQP